MVSAFVVGSAGFAVVEGTAVVLACACVVDCASVFVVGSARVVVCWRVVDAAEATVVLACDATMLVGAVVVTAVVRDAARAVVVPAEVAVAC